MTDPIYCPYCGTKDLLDGTFRFDMKKRLRTFEIVMHCKRCTQCGRGFYPIPVGEYQ